MQNLNLKTMLLLMIVALATACGASPAETTPVQEPVVEEAQPAQAVATEEAMADDKMSDEAMTDEAMAEAKMDDEAMTDEAMADEAMADEAMAEAKMDDEVMTDEAMADETEGGEAMSTPAWFNVALTDVNTGESFTIADLQGKVVVVETMAVWCPLCTTQQGHIQAMQEIVGQRDDLVSLSLDIDPNESSDILSAHAQKNGFGWHYAVAPAEVAREIGQLYGAQFLNPPATPMFIIDRHGEVHLLPFGHKDSRELAEAVAPLLEQS